MTAHRPHPITGPWPYVTTTTRTHAEVADDRRRGIPTPLVERAPTDDAVIYDDPEGAVLYDGCDRCAQHAQHPFSSLDDDHLRPLVAAALEGGLAHDPPPQPTAMQAAAVSVIRHEYRVASSVIERVFQLTGGIPLGLTAAHRTLADPFAAPVGADEEG